MKRRLAIIAVFALVLAVLPSGFAAGATGDGFMFEVDSNGVYAYNEGRQNDIDSGFEATFVGYLDGTWVVNWTLISPDAGTYAVAAGIAGICTGNTQLFTITASEDVTVSGTWTGSASPPSNYNFIRVYPTNELCQTRWAGWVDQPYGMITAPPAGSVQFGIVNFGATYYDNDYDPVQWAVRKDTCAAATNTVAGNVDGFTNAYSWDGMHLAATVDTSTWLPGDYCFVFNTSQDSHENDVRLTREFKIRAPVTTSCPAGEMFVSSVGLGSDTPVVPSSSALTNGVKYTATASGVYYAGGRFLYDIAADAQYSQDAYQRSNALGWTDLVHDYEGHGPGLLDLEVNGVSGVWGAFSSSHQYTTTLWGDGSPATFQIYDIYAQNNTGGLCVSVEPVFDGMWLPPITNADFELRNGSTLPIKFQVKYSGMPPLTPEQTPVNLKMYGPVNGGMGTIGTWSLADGSLKFNYETGAYVALFHTKDFELVNGATYTVVVYDSATGDPLGSFEFSVDLEKGTSRGNSGK